MSSAPHWSQYSSTSSLVTVPQYPLTPLSSPHCPLCVPSCLVEGRNCTERWWQVARPPAGGRVPAPPLTHTSMIQFSASIFTISKITFSISKVLTSAFTCDNLLNHFYKMALKQHLKLVKLSMKIFIERLF